MNFRLIFGLMFLLVMVGGVVGQADVGYVVNNPLSLDSNEEAVIDFLIVEGYNVEILNDVSFDASIHDLIIVSESVRDIEGVFNNNNYKTLFLSNSAAKKSGLGSGVSLTSGDEIVLTDVNNIITGDFLLGDLGVYFSQENILSINFPFQSGFNNLAYKSKSYKGVLVIFEKDLDKGINERNVFFGLFEASNWNDNAESLFENSINWLMDDIDEPVCEPSEEICNDVDDDCDGDVDEDGVCDGEPVEGDLSIVSYTPNVFDVKILDGEAQDFNVVVSDVGADVEWFIDDVVVGNGWNYFFDESLGSYDLSVVALEGGESASNDWSVFVGGIVDFTCSEVGGYVCSNRESCSEDYLGVSGSLVCCPVICDENPLEFSDIDKGEISGDIKVEIERPNVDEEFELGDVVRMKLDIDNNVDDNLDIDIEVYLYDLTEDEVVEDYSATTELDDDSHRIVNVDVKLPYDVDEDNDYALFVQIEDEDGDYYNEDYVEIGLKRVGQDVVIEKIDVVDVVDCGDFFDVEVRVANAGSDDQDIYLKIENPILGIDERTEVFELEEYGGDDVVKETFSFRIPDDVIANDYGLKVSVYFGNTHEELVKSILVNCESANMNGVDVVSLNGESSSVVVKNGDFNWLMIFGFVVMGILVLGLVGVGVGFKWFKNGGK